MPSTPRAISRRIIEAASASESCESAISTSVPCFGGDVLDAPEQRQVEGVQPGDDDADRVDSQATTR